MHIIATYYQDSDPILLFSENGKYGLCDGKRRVLSGAEYDAITPCGTRGFLLLQGKKYGFIRFDKTSDELPAAWISCSYDCAEVHANGLQLHNMQHLACEESYLMEDFLWVNTYTGESYPAHTLESERGCYCILNRINENNELTRMLVETKNDRTLPLESVNVVGEMPLDDWSDCLVCEELIRKNGRYSFVYFFMHLDDDFQYQSKKCSTLRDMYALLADYVREKFPAAL